MDAQISVLMAVHNGEPYIRVAVESILNQTYKNFIFLIVDDASTDSTVDIIKSYNDHRIELIELKENIGQTAALNVGLKNSHTPWIARMDADDYSVPTRLEEQMKVASEDDSICCVGTFAWIFSEDPNVIEEILTKPLTNLEIRKVLLKEPSVIHGSLLVRLESLMSSGCYDERYRYSADFDLYDRLLIPSRKAINIPKPLLGIRRHEGQGSRSVMAIEEGIDIYKRRLISGGYSPNEIKEIKSALSFFYLLRVRFRLKSKQINKLLIEDLLHAIFTSPWTFITYCKYSLKVFTELFH